jgi:RNA polymerase sigma-70 factor, ECF subfamily
MPERPIDGAQGGPLEGPAARTGRLYDLHGPSLYRYAVMLLANASDAEDVIQQVFAALLKQSAIETTIASDADYLRRAVRNECYSLLRRRRHRPLIAWSDDRESLAPGFLEPACADARPEERLALERALRTLPADQREVVHLHVYEGMTFQQIADACDESINTIASRYRYALVKLRDLLS